MIIASSTTMGGKKEGGGHLLSAESWKENEYSKFYNELINTHDWNYVILQQGKSPWNPNYLHVEGVALHPQKWSF